MNNFYLLLTSPSSIYVILRYFTYIFQFVNAILLAHHLGEYYFGIYSFILLIMQYMSYSNLGINESLNTEYAANKSNIEKINTIWNNTWSINITLNFILTLVCVLLFYTHKHLFESYQFNDYKYILLGTCILINLSKVYVTYYRLWGQLYKLNIQQILPNLILFVFIIFFQQYLSINGIVIVLFVCNAISLLIFRMGLPVIPKFIITKNIAGILIKRGTALLLYNLSFYLLTLFASTIVSLHYSIEIFGCYSFANTIVNGVIMAGGAFLFVFYPKILNRFSKANSEASILIKKIRNIYIVFIDLISLISILFVIGITIITPQYGTQMIIIYSILILGRIINNASSGYAAFLIAQKKERHLMIYGFLSVIIVGICGIFIHYWNLSVKYVAISVCITSFFYTFLVNRKALLCLNKPFSIKLILQEIFGMNKWFACIIIILYAFFIPSHYILMSSIFLYCIYNINNIKHAVNNGIRIIADKKSLSF